MFKWFGSLMVAAAATTNGRSNMLLVDINAHGSVHSHTSLMRTERDRGKKIKCWFTIDDVVSSAYYGEAAIKASGGMRNWKSTKTLNFEDLAKPLTIAGYDKKGGVSGHCGSAGFAITCDNGVKSGLDVGWMVYDSSSAIDDDHKKGKGTGWRSPNTSTSRFYLKARRETPKICGASGKQFMAFRWTPPGFTAGVCKVTLYASSLETDTGCEIVCPADKVWSACSNFASNHCRSFDNKISGLAVIGKARVQLCHDQNCRGKCKTYTSTTSASTLLSGGDTGKFSSIKIQRIA